MADGQLSPEEACRHYHGRLAAAGITPSRALEDDLVVHTPELKEPADMGYDASRGAVLLPPPLELQPKPS